MPANPVYVHMSTRRKLFSALVLFFFVMAPLLIAYSLGYTFVFSRRSVEQVGGIFLKSRTPSVSVFLDNRFVKQTSFLPGGALLTNVSPTIHLVRVEKAGYQPWSKTVEVKATLVTELRDILLATAPVPYATTSPDVMSGIRAEENFSPPLTITRRGDLVADEDGVRRVLAPHVRSFGRNLNQVYFVDENGFLARLDLATRAIAVVGRPGFYLNPQQPFQYIFSPSGEVVVIDSARGGYLADDSGEVKSLGGSVRGSSFDSGGKKLLVWNDHRIELVWRADNARQPFQKKGTRETLFALNSTIRDVRWFYGDDAHVIIRGGDGLFLTEIDGRGGRNTVELFSERVDELLTHPSLPNKIFFRRARTWYTIE